MALVSEVREALHTCSLLTFHLQRLLRDVKLSFRREQNHQVLTPAHFPVAVPMFWGRSTARDYSVGNWRFGAAYSFLTK
ncbi:hypothetical protein E2C01_102366 [Portunus trituberculatus]|uniref:Uncharacterized protein n=1 Tax=Portunus trituberculatus TaxID=210409 RepID=A0A5B7KH47_PORTR|nr:hypothetical protein [Portunus trituberculatus]